MSGVESRFCLSKKSRCLSSFDKDFLIVALGKGGPCQRCAGLRKRGCQRHIAAVGVYVFHTDSVDRLFVLFVNVVCVLKLLAGMILER